MTVEMGAYRPLAEHFANGIPQSLTMHMASTEMSQALDILYLHRTSSISCHENTSIQQWSS